MKTQEILVLFLRPSISSLDRKLNRTTHANRMLTYYDRNVGVLDLSTYKYIWYLANLSYRLGLVRLPKEPDGMGWIGVN